MSEDFTQSFYGDVLLLRPPVPVTFNKAGANYKSETAHELYFPRQAYEEWLSICEGILHFGGDALFDFEAEDDMFLDHEELHVDAQGAVYDSSKLKRLGHVDDILTGRVFTANGPWVQIRSNTLRAFFPNMLDHRKAEIPYYEKLLDSIATTCGFETDYSVNPYRWEGLADVALLQHQAVLTFTVPGHYDQGVGTKTLRSSIEGIRAAAQFAGISHEAQLCVELVYPHFHGDTVHFVARSSAGVFLFHYAGGIWPADRTKVPTAHLVAIDQTDAVEHYAANSRQVRGGLLIPEGPSNAFYRSVEQIGLEPYSVRLSELFGKAGGGPACATLYLPSTLPIPTDFPYRYSVRRQEARDRASRIPQRVFVDRNYFQSKKRG